MPVAKKKRVSISLSPDNVFHNDEAADVVSSQRDLMDMLAILGAPDVTVIDTFRKNFPKESTAQTDHDIVSMYHSACDRREAARANNDDSPSTQAAELARRGTTAATSPEAADASKGDSGATEAINAFQFPSSDDGRARMTEQEQKEMDAFIRDVLGRKPRRASAFLREVEIAAIESAQQEEEDARAMVDAAKKAAAVAISGKPEPHAVKPAAKAVHEDPEDPIQRPSGIAPLCVHIEEEGVPLHKVIYVAPSVTFEEFRDAVEEKLQKAVLLTFKDQEDYVEIDDISVLSMFLYQIQREQEAAAKAKPGQRRRSYAGPNTYTHLICLDAPTKSNSAAAIISAASAVAAQSPDHAARRTSRRFSAAFTSGLVAIQPIETYDAHKNGAHCCDYSPDGSRVVSVGRDREVRIWKTREGGKVGRHQGIQMRGNHSGFVLCCAWSPRGDRIATAAVNGTIKVWDVDTLEKYATLKGHDDRVYGIRFDAAGTVIASASCDGSVRVWDATIPGTSRKQLKVKYQPGTKYDPTPFFACDFPHDKDNSMIAIAGDNAVVKLFDWRIDKVGGSFEGHEGAVWSVRYSSDDSRLVTCGNDNDVRVWDVKTRASLFTLSGHEAPVHSAVFSADSRFLFSCGRDWMVMAWDAKTGEHMETIAGHTNTVYHVETRGQELLSCALDSTVKRWEVRSIE